MLQSKARKLRLESERLVLRAPVHTDYRDWATLRSASMDFLIPWEPTWAPDHLSRKSFTNRVYWARRSIKQGSAFPLFIFRASDDQLVGAITLDNIWRGPAQAATIGYWMGKSFARQGYMREAIWTLSDFAFGKLDLSRIQAACLPENNASRGVLEKAGFKYEGVAQSYLQINGRWRNHVLYAALRNDRRGRATTG